MKNSKTMFIVQAAVIAAMYAALTLMQNILLPGSAWMAIQFRVSEALTVLALFTPAAIPGLTVGCIASNISMLSSLGPADLIFGSLASFLAAVTMYALRNVRLFRQPIPAILMPAVMNGMIVGFEIDFFFTHHFSFDFTTFIITAGLVAVGELAVLVVLGLPLFHIIDKRGLTKVTKMVQGKIRKNK